VLAGGCAQAQTVELTSPGGKLSATLEVRQGVLTYRVNYGGRPLLLDSQLGLSLYSGIYQFAGHTARTSDTTWSPVYGERATIRDRYREQTVRLRDQAAPHRELELIVRAYDEGFAFRYRIPGKAHVLYAQESSEFRFPEAASGYEEHGTEGEYRRVPVSAIEAQCERPLTVDYGNGLYASLTEAANVDYPRMLLSPVRGKPGTLVSDLGGPVEVDAPYATPWRVLVAGERPGDLLERSYLVANLNPPSAIRDSSWIKPGKVIREVTLSTKGGKAAVDFAVAHGLQYVEYDAGWYGYEYLEASDATHVSLDPQRVGSIPDHGGLDLPAVIAYARERGVGVFLYVNRRALERQLDEILPLYRKWGVVGMKFGFVNVGLQTWTAWLHDAIRKAAGYQLLVDVHDSYRPTGFARTYPNLLTQEGVRGNEHMPTATHNTTLPFTRFVAGPADYTVCYYSDRIQTTRAHQLALPVVFYSPLQFLYWYDRPAAYHGEPEIEFFDKVPTVWDETRVLDGKIGEYAVVARRSGREWYIGAINGETPRVLRIDLSFLPAGVPYTAQIYGNGPTRNDVTIERRQTGSAGQIEARLPAAGGQAVRLVPDAGSPPGKRP
jgi:alpha-glucosidase